MEIRPVGTVLIHAVSRTDGHDEGNRHYPQLCKRA